MGKVLLAIEGMSPDRQVFDYAVNLCRRIRAELNILHIIDPTKIARPKVAGRFQMLRKQMDMARGCLEKTMMAATFAETGEHDFAREIMDEASANIKRLLAEKDQTSVDYRVKIKTGNSGAAILDYVDRHRDIVLAIYDAPLDPERPSHAAGEERGEASVPEDIKQQKDFVTRLQKQLSVPLVVRRGDAPAGMAAAKE